MTARTLRLFFLVIGSMTLLNAVAEALEFLAHHTLIHYLVNGAQLLGFATISATSLYAVGVLQRHFVRDGDLRQISEGTARDEADGVQIIDDALAAPARAPRGSPRTAD